MVLVRGWRRVVWLAACWVAFWIGGRGFAEGFDWQPTEPAMAAPMAMPASLQLQPSGWRQPPALPPVNSWPQDKTLRLKLAYGRTFGTSTELDYATLEISRQLQSFPAMTSYGPAVGEVQLAVLASYVVYYEGTLEKIKRLNFADGYELAWLPKGRFSFGAGPFGSSTFLESGAGIGYVSETYRNSGSRWNWSLLGGVGFERCLPGRGTVSFGLQWRHLSNGNMWGKGDELHNSNSGTDMVQGMATFVQPF